MKFIRVTEFTPPSDQIFVGTSYPGPGIYISEPNQAIYFVTQDLMVSAYTFGDFTIEERDIENPGVSEALFLHALKIVAGGGRD